MNELSKYKKKQVLSIIYTNPKTSIHVSNECDLQGVSHHLLEPEQSMKCNSYINLFVYT